jgi:hypothetical protein
MKRKYKISYIDNNNEEIVFYGLVEIVKDDSIINVSIDTEYMDINSMRPIMDWVRSYGEALCRPTPIYYDIILTLLDDNNLFEKIKLYHCSPSNVYFDGFEGDELNVTMDIICQYYQYLLD